MMKLWVNTLTFIVSTEKLLFLFLFVVMMSTKLLLVDETPQHTVDKESKTKEQPKLSIMTLEPDVSDYRGDTWSRCTLLGDMGGIRQELYEKGVALVVKLTQPPYGHIPEAIMRLS